MIKIYGIPNCDTVKKARRWLEENQVAYEFIDFKKTPPDKALIEKWLADIPMEVLLNKRGTTWRKLDEAQKVSVENHDAAIALMVDQPSLIKRPIADIDGHYHAGFQIVDYESFFRK
ncbi:hypothetical protein PL75_02510 [Neisseria arctica]|uniref:Arsenate reductase n=1 Tax=Neisseria arctica TaxID=1470200 RepID=A0A0J0YTY0_9NEIS|nr:ArsC family reductase [Neisseria arctica]KLT73561.1 hypothetical protein PL75_02510 [Neisseria arctica]UOO86126.1 ArsC family reductase [Neisseria arctica]